MRTTCLFEKREVCTGIIIMSPDYVFGAEVTVECDQS